MGWNEIDNKLKQIVDRLYVSCDEDYELEKIRDLIRNEFPYISTEDIDNAISKCCNLVTAPRIRKKFIKCIKDILS